MHELLNHRLHNNNFGSTCIKINNYGIYCIKVGACIVDAGNKIVGIGHNKLPDGVDEEKFEFWENGDIEKDGFMKTKYPYGECMSLHLAVPHVSHVIIIEYANIHDANE